MMPMLIMKDLHRSDDSAGLFMPSRAITRNDFQSRQIIANPPLPSRTLLIIFIESHWFFEKATATLYNYKIAQSFGDTHILDQFKEIIGRWQMNDRNRDVRSGRFTFESSKI